MDCLHQTEPSSMQAWPISCRKPCLENWLRFALFKVQLVNENFCTGQLVNDKQTILKRTFVFSLILISLIFSFVSKKYSNFFPMHIIMTRKWISHDHTHHQKELCAHILPMSSDTSCIPKSLILISYLKSQNRKKSNMKALKDVKVDARVNSLSPRTSIKNPIWKHF